MKSASRQRWRFGALGLVGLAAVGLAACGPGAETTEERIEGAREEADGGEDAAPLAELATGSFEARFTGAIEEGIEGEAVCTHAPPTQELRLVMRAREDPERSVVITVPEYDGTGTYEAQVLVSGAERLTGSGQAAVSRVRPEPDVLEDELAVAFRGSYAGTPGSGDVEGTARCTPGPGD